MLSRRVRKGGSRAKWQRKYVNMLASVFGRGKDGKENGEMDGGLAGVEPRTGSR
jgi:hypothetical protein